MDDRQEIEALFAQIASLNAQVFAYSLAAESLIRTATVADKTSTAAHLDVALENWPDGTVGLAGFESAHAKLRALLVAP